MRDKFVHFMENRYGTDELTIFGIVVSMIVLMINITVKSQILGLVALVLLAYFGIYRVYSTNRTKRYKERVGFLNATKPIRDFIAKFTTKAKGIKQYRYYKCPSCKTRLKVPRGKGKIKITCPNCKHQFIKKS